MRSWLYVCRPSRIKVSVAGSKIAAVHHRTQWLHSSSSESSGGTPERVIFSGIQPTGVPHLGNYLGALRPWVQLQDEKTSKDQLNFSIVDLHALTVPQDPKQLESWRMDTYVALLAVGLDTKRSRVFFQSQVGPVRDPNHRSLTTAAFSSYGIDVDSQHCCLYRIPGAHDPVEGMSSFTFHIPG